MAVVGFRIVFVLRSSVFSNITLENRKHPIILFYCYNIFDILGRFLWGTFFFEVTKSAFVASP